MNILHFILCIICLWLGWRYLRLRGDIRSLCGQLDEIGQGSHMELTANCRQSCILILCRKLNQVLSAKDTAHIQYEKAQRQLKQNITNLAHDIRTPLTGAFGYVQLALETNDAGKKERYLQTVQNRLSELEDMLEKLFLYTKLTSEAFAFAPESIKEIQLLPFLGECLLSLYAQFEKSGTSPKVRFESENFRIYAEEEALRRIFLNLIQNALIHGTGELAIYQRNDTPTVNNPNIDFAAGRKAVSQTGQKAEPQINPQAGTDKIPCLIFENPVPAGYLIDTAQIFERFYKADTARGKASSGLGLFIVKELMLKMGGNVKARLCDNKLQIILQFGASMLEHC